MLGVYSESGEAVEQIAQTSCGFPIPEGIKARLEGPWTIWSSSQSNGQQLCPCQGIGTWQYLRSLQLKPLFDSNERVKDGYHYATFPPKFGRGLEK